MLYAKGNKRIYYSLGKMSLTLSALLTILFFARSILFGQEVLPQTIPAISMEQNINAPEETVMPADAAKLAFSSPKTSESIQVANPPDVNQAEPTLEELQKTMEQLQKEVSGMKKGLDKAAEDKKKNPTYKIGGFLIADALFTDQSDANKTLYNDIQNQYQFRDVRLSVTGKIINNINYDVTIAYNNGVKFKNVMLDIKDMPYLGDTRVGYFKVETGMNYLTNIYNATFLDFDGIASSFNLGRRLGVGSAHLFNDKSIRWYNGVYLGKDFDFSSDKEAAYVSADNPGIVLNTRLTAAPLYCENADGHLERLFHVGGSFTWSEPYGSEANKVRVRYRPNGWSNPMTCLLDGSIPLYDGHFSIAEVEAAYQVKEFSIQSELYTMDLSSYSNVTGTSLTAKYFLTKGAYQEYKKDIGAFGGVYIPENCELFDCGDCRCLKGWGVWELAGQWSLADMDHLQNLPGTKYFGTVNSYALGLNWYWNKFTRWTFNYIYTEADTAAAGSKDTYKTSNNTWAAQLKVRF